MQFDRLSLSVGQAFDRGSEGGDVFADNRNLARCCLVSGQQSLESHGRLREFLLHGPLSPDVAFVTMEVSIEMADLPDENLSQPRSQFRFGPAAELVDRSDGLQHGLLDDVGRPDFGPIGGTHVSPSEHSQIGLVFGDPLWVGHVCGWGAARRFIGTVGCGGLVRRGFRHHSGTQIHGNLRSFLK